MKDVTIALAEHLNREKHFVSCDIYELWLENGNKYYYTGADQDVIIGDKIYKSAFLIERQKVKLNDCVVVDSLSVGIYANQNDYIENRPLMAAAHSGILDNAKLYLSRCFFKDNYVLGTIALFGGNVEIKKCCGLKLELTVKAKTQGLAREFPIRRYYPQGAYTSVDGIVAARGDTDGNALITPFVPLKEVLI